jgi:AcrR family transcriptional regulator
MDRRVRISNAARGVRGEGSDKPAERRGTGRTVRGRESRQALVRAARVVFERDGFLHARIADICKEASTSHGSFYTYFVSKEEIFNEVVDSVEIDLLHLEPSTKTASRDERIRSANQHYLDSYLQNADILTVIQQVATFDPEVRETRLQRQDEFARTLEKRIREYQGEGVADGRIDAWLAANALGGMVAFVAEQVAAGRLAFDTSAVVDQLTVLWANALGLPPDDHATTRGSRSAARAIDQQGRPKKRTISKP